MGELIKRMKVPENERVTESTDKRDRQTDRQIQRECLYERERDRQRQRQTDRDRETETQRHTDRQRQGHGQTDRQTETERRRQRNRNRETDRQTDRVYTNDDYEIGQYAVVFL